jgi:hypothetical protein
LDGTGVTALVSGQNGPTRWRSARSEQRPRGGLPEDLSPIHPGIMTASNRHPDQPNKAQNKHSSAAQTASKTAKELLHNGGYSRASGP